MGEKPRVMLVDDDENLISAMKRNLRSECILTTANSGSEALNTMSSAPEFSVLISDQNMPGMKGDALLFEAARRWPMTVRVMLTGNNDQSTAAAAVNSGQVFRFLRKPCDPEELVEAIRAAHKHYRMLIAEKELLEKTLAGSIRVLTEVLHGVRPDLFERAQDVRRYARLLAERVSLARIWETDLAAMLYPLGLLFIPDDVAKRYVKGDKLALAEQQIIDMSMETASRLINNIPRLDNVADGIGMCRQGFDGSGTHAKDAKGQAIPQIARVLRLAIDIVDAVGSKRANSKTIASYIKERARLYDPELIDAAIDVAREQLIAKEAQSRTVIRVPPKNLSDRDILAEDLVDRNGKRLLPKGAELTHVSIIRLGQLEKAGLLREEISVLRPGKSAA